jgi:hypothetical protein
LNIVTDSLFYQLKSKKLLSLFVHVGCFICILGIVQTVSAQEDIDPSLFSSDHIWLEDPPIDPNCEVDIRGDSPVMYPGNFTSLSAAVRGGVIPEGYAWAIEPDIVKDYDDEVFDSSFRLLSGVDPPIPMAPSDFQKPKINFYWKSEADAIRTVGLRVLTEDGICQDIESYTVKVGNTSDTQPEDFYVLSNHPMKNSTRVLQEHAAWHNEYHFRSPSYNDKGDSFLQFHKIYLAHFDTFRNVFGYPPIKAWDPGTPLPSGSDIDHDARSINSYISQGLPSWFMAHPSGNGPVERKPTPDLPCETADAPSVSWSDKTQDSLNDFEPDKELLGCALTGPYHNSRHVAVGGRGEGGDMSVADRAPRDPIFWRLHKFIDDVSDGRDDLTPFGRIGNATLIDAERGRPISVAFIEKISSTAQKDPVTLDQGTSTIPNIAINDTSPPQIESQSPKTDLPFITDKLEELGITFNEPVENVVATDLTVNESPATTVSGLGLGPYIFTGFSQPLVGSVNVSLTPGNITDLSENLFKGDSWNYTLVVAKNDGDRDGITDGLEIEELLTDPTSSDTDRDGIPDGFEADTDCLNPLVDDSKVVNFIGEVVNSTGKDFDNDGITNVDEFKQQTSPCVP